MTPEVKAAMERRRKHLDLCRDKNIYQHACPYNCAFDEQYDKAILADAFLASVAVDGWRPIESAPKDGEFILGWCKQWRDGVVQCRWLRGDGRWNTVMQPTHWMPLPVPPPVPAAKEPTQP